MKTKSTSSNAKYKQAFMKQFKCSKDEFEIKKVMGSGMLAKYKNNVYTIFSEDDMWQYLEEMVTVEEVAVSIPVYTWIEIAESAHLQSAFYRELLPELNEDEKGQLSQALIFSDHSDDAIETFWFSLYYNGSAFIYPKAIIASAKLYDLETIKSELLELIDDDDSPLIEVEGGVFESIYINEEDNDASIFYIFTVSPINWEV